MTLIMMFDRTATPSDEIRFSLFKFKLAKFPRPACDWQYVIHHVEPGQEYGFRARLVWKKFVSADDCRARSMRSGLLRNSPATAAGSPAWNQALLFRSRGFLRGENRWRGSVY